MSNILNYFICFGIIALVSYLIIKLVTMEFEKDQFNSNDDFIQSMEAWWEIASRTGNIERKRARQFLLKARKPMNSDRKEDHK